MLSLGSNTLHGQFSAASKSISDHALNRFKSKKKMFKVYGILDKLLKIINFMAELKENATIFFLWVCGVV